jgi:hypothetical protein
MATSTSSEISPTNRECSNSLPSNVCTRAASVMLETS